MLFLQSTALTMTNAKLIELIVADKYIDVNPPDYTIKNADTYNGSSIRQK